ncbi:MAG: flagellar hook-length control protein FliK [Planctomycetes bacterium]|nr:flagellar hook-length control protein FliK [Planctomycetota bacterium]
MEPTLPIPAKAPGVLAAGLPPPTSIPRLATSFSEILGELLSAQAKEEGPARPVPRARPEPSQRPEEQNPVRPDEAPPDPGPSRAEGGPVRTRDAGRDELRAPEGPAPARERPSSGGPGGPEDRGVSCEPACRESSRAQQRDEGPVPARDETGDPGPEEDPGTQSGPAVLAPVENEAQVDGELVQATLPVVPVPAGTLAEVDVPLASVPVEDSGSVLADPKAEALPGDGTQKNETASEIEDASREENSAPTGGVPRGEEGASKSRASAAIELTARPAGNPERPGPVPAVSAMPARTGEAATGEGAELLAAAEEGEGIRLEPDTGDLRGELLRRSLAEDGKPASEDESSPSSGRDAQADLAGRAPGLRNEPLPGTAGGGEKPQLEPGSARSGGPSVLANSTRGDAVSAGAKQADQVGEARTAPPEGTRNPAGVSQEEAIERIARMARLTRSGERSTARVWLRPPELGSVRVQVTVERGAVSAELRVETQAARDAFLAQLPALENRFGELGMKVSGLAVHLFAGGTGKEPEHGGERGLKVRNRPSARESEEREPAAPGADSAAAVRLPPGRSIDLLI